MYSRTRSSSQWPYSACSVSSRLASSLEVLGGIVMTRYSVCPARPLPGAGNTVVRAGVLICGILRMLGGSGRSHIVTIYELPFCIVRRYRLNMTVDPRAALDRLLAALESHYTAVAGRRGPEDPAVDDAYYVLADAFGAYDDALGAVHGEALPFLLVDDEEEDDEEEDEDLAPPYREDPVPDEAFDDGPDEDQPDDDD